MLPLVKGDWLVDGQHITAMGADDLYKRELDSTCFEKAAAIYVDSIQLNKQYGEFSEALNQQPAIMDKTHEFGQLFSQVAPIPQKDEVTIAKLVGLGVQDLAAATVVMSKYFSL